MRKGLRSPLSWLVTVALLLVAATAWSDTLRPPGWTWKNNFGYNGAEVPGYLLSSPSLGRSGTVYFGSSGSAGSYLVGVNPPPAGQTQGTRRFVASGFTDERVPTIGADNTLYLTDGYDYVYAHSGDTGAQLWRWGNFTWMTGTPALGPDNTIYVQYGSGYSWTIGLSPDPSIPIHDLSRVRFLQGQIVDVPAIGADGTVYGAWGNTITARKPYDPAGGTGDILWSYTTPLLDPPAWENATLGSKFISIGPDGTVYFTMGYYHTALSYYFTELYALHPDPAAPLRLKWSVNSNVDDPAQGDALGPVVIGPDGKTLYLATTEFLWAFDTSVASGQKIRFSFYPPGGRLLSNPAVGADGTVYIVAPYDNDAVTSNGWYASSLYALDNTGAVLWISPAGWNDNGAVNASISTPVIGPDGTVHFGGNDGRLYAVAGNVALPPPAGWPMSEHDAQHTRRADAPVAAADLAEIALGAPPATVSTGSSIPLSDTVANKGNAASVATTTRYYLSADALRNPGDVVLASRTVASLAPGASSPYSSSVTVPSMPAGTYYLLVCADDGAGIRELSELNNCLASASTVQVVAPDLVETSVTNPPATSRSAGTFSVTDTAYNQGNAATGKTTYTRYYLSADTVKGAGDVLLTGSRTVASLAAGGSSSGSKTVTVPTTAPGNYYLLACADDNTLVVEASETNNCKASATTVRVGPDLVVSTIANPPASVVVGNGFSVTDKTLNQGGASTGKTTLTRYYLSYDNAWSAGDVRLTGSRSVASLAAAGSSTGTVTVTVPAMSGGAYYLLACADDNAAVVEASEGNNCKSSAATTSVTGPDLTVRSLSTPPAVVRVGDNVAMTDNTYNQGNATSGTTTTRFHLSVNTVKDAADILLTGTRSVPALAASGSSAGTTTVRIPSVAAGYYYILACSDDTAVVVETGESNNCRASSRVQVTP